MSSVTSRKPVKAGHAGLVAESCALACVLTFAGTAGASAAHVHAWMPDLAVLVLGGAAIATTEAVTRSMHMARAVTGWAILLAAWAIHARFDHLPAFLGVGRVYTVWSGVAIAELAVPAALLTAATVRAYGAYLDELTDGGARPDLAMLRRYEDVLARLGADGVRCLSVDEGRAGATVKLRLPRSGRVTLKTLHQLPDGVATALRLPANSVSFTQSRHAGEAFMHLDTKDILSVDVPYPPCSPGDLLTITQPVDIGVQSNGDVASVLLREVAALVIGVTGAGKSNFLNVLMAQLTRCPDVVVLGVDLKGGRLFAPWIMPWIRGDCPRPAIDWVATNRQETEVMLRAIDRVITARGESLIGGSKIKPTPAMPQFVLITDEIADVLGSDVPRSEQGDGTSNATMTAVATRITRKCRSEAVMPIWATQRATVTMLGSGDLKSQCKLRFALGVATEADARSIVADDTRAARLLAGLQHPGSAIVWKPGRTSPMPLRFYRLDPENDSDAKRIDELARVAGHTRPGPDTLSATAMGADYTERWERSSLYQRLAAQHAGLSAADVVASGPDTTGAATVTRTDVKPVADTTAADFAAIMSAEGMASAKPDPKARMFSLLGERPIFGLSVVEIEAVLRKENMGVRRETIHRWLKAEIEGGTIERTGQGVGSRYRFAPRP